MKRIGKHRTKLDCHDFTGVSIGYSVTMANVRYINLMSGLTKTCGHPMLEKAWYLLATRPPTAQLLYSLGLEREVRPPRQRATEQRTPEPLPTMPLTDLVATPVAAKLAALPLRLGTETPAAAQRVARMTKEEHCTHVQDPFRGTAVDGRHNDQSGHHTQGHGAGILLP